MFTHDILFATTLLSLFEKSKRCSYFQITDEDGKGKVTRATGPRWDTLSGIKGKINDTINAARSQDGEARDALVRVGYGWVRSWCEVFTETELLQGVSQRYKPNIGMTMLAKINTEKLGDIIPKVTEVFEDACRYIDGHSQPLITLWRQPHAGRARTALGGVAGVEEGQRGGRVRAMEGSLPFRVQAPGNGI